MTDEELARANALIETRTFGPSNGEVCVLEGWQSLDIPVSLARQLIDDGLITAFDPDAGSEEDPGPDRSRPGYFFAIVPPDHRSLDTDALWDRLERAIHERTGRRIPKLNPGGAFEVRKLT